jgi:hypothetical protein
MTTDTDTLPLFAEPKQRTAAEAWLWAMRTYGSHRTLDEWADICRANRDLTGVYRGISGAALSARFRREFGDGGQYQGQIVKTSRAGNAPVYGLAEDAR